MVAMNLPHILNDELLDIVNENDEVIGQKYRSNVYQQKSSNFRVINAFVINDKNEIWIPTRTADKKLFPLCLDASVGGHVSAGEEYITAFQRETMEELNIDTNKVSYKLLTKLTPHDNKVSAFMHLYAIYSNETPAYNPKDFSHDMWVNIKKLKDMISNGQKAKGDLPVLINTLEQFI